MYQKHCPGCFENKQGLAQCPHCGYDESLPRSALLLPHGTMLANTYRIGRVLGKPGGFGVTYLAWDSHLQQRVAVKEYFPRELVARDPDTMLVSVHQSEQEGHFKFGLDQFLSEARLIAKFDHPNIVRVRNFFRAHGTAYMVMDYYEGRSLGDYLLQLDAAVEPQIAASLLLPVLDGLQFVHDRGVVHRDVKPHNIYLTGAGRTILLDFGAARQAAGEEAESLMVVLSEGYAPLEQYQKNSPQGPWTDIYGVGATLYRMIIGKAPPAALDRLGADPLEGDLGLSEALSVVLRKALGLRPSQRFATALEFKQALAAVFAPGDDTRVSRPSHSITLSPATETRPVAWGAPIDGPTTVRPAHSATAPIAQPPSPLPNSAPAWGPAWLIAGAIVLGALIISLPLWLR